MNILVADTAPLYPPLWGGPLRIFNNFSNFRSKVEYAGVEINPDFKPTTRNVGGIRESIIKPDKRFYTIRKFQQKILPGLTFDIYTYLFMRSDKNYRRLIKSKVRGKDVLISSHLWAFPALLDARKKGQLLIYDSHNVEYLLMRQITRGRVAGLFISHAVRMMEECACKNSDLIIACSEDDKKSLSKLYNIAQEKILLVPNSVDQIAVSKAKRSAARKKLGLKGFNLLFVGAHFNPNNEALEFIMKKLAPKMKDMTFQVAGRVKHAAYDLMPESDWPKNVKFHGQVSKEMFDELRCGCDAAINPMFHGSGMQIKMLDYLAAGLPIVSTPVGARGLGIRNEAIICSENDFERNIRKLSKDSLLRQRLSERATKKSFEFDSKSVAREFEKALIRFASRADSELYFSGNARGGIFA